MPRVSTGRVGAAFGAMLVLGAASAVPAQRLVLPAGTVIIARTTSPLESATAQNGQNFDATVTENLGGLLSEGRDVSVPAETPLAVELDRAVSLRGRGRLRGDDANTIYTAAERVKEGQQALARLGYYRGAINGALDDATRRALFQFQVDKGLNGTGNLDGRTAQALGVNLSGGLSGSALSADAASALRRDAQSLVSRARAEIGATTAGRLDATRTYAQGDLELWFALSAFEDNASNYEAIVRSGGNADAAIFAGRALVNAARRVDSAVQGTRVSAELQNGWTNLRRQIATLDTVR